MPATELTFGITRHEGALIQSVETSKKVEKKELRGSNGEIAKIHTFGVQTTFNVKGYGALSFDVGVIEDPGISDFPTEGFSLIDEVKDMESNDDFNSWEYSGVNYPFAEAG